MKVKRIIVSYNSIEQSDTGLITPKFEDMILIRRARPAAFHESQYSLLETEYTYHISGILRQSRVINHGGNNETGIRKRDCTGDDV